MRGWLIDASINGDLLNLKLVTESGELTQLELPVLERLYLTPQKVPLRQLEAALESAPGVERVRAEEWLTPPWYRSSTSVLAVDVRPSKARSILRRVRALGLAEVWNTFPSAVQRALRRLGLTACAWVEVDGESVYTTEDLDSVRYDLPELRWIRVSFEGWAGRPNVPSLDFVDRMVVEAGGSEQALPVERAGELADLIERIEPHLAIFDGPDWLELALGIDGVREALKHVGTVILPRSPPLDIDLLGLVEWCRIAAMPPRLAVNASIGQVLTSAEAFEAMRRRYLVPEVRSSVEGWKSPGRLLAADRGGVVLTPRPGVYWGVYQLDFNSLFPSIIARENVSPETVNDPACRGPRRRVPEVGHEICLDRRGLVADVVGRLVERRARLRGLARTLPGGEGRRYEPAQSAVKWILVACFGYLGYRNARFGSIEAYECVTALARGVARRAIEVAEGMGYRVLHALVDSIFVQPKRDAISLGELIRAIEEETGYSLKVEAEYEWVAFFSGETTGEGVPSRYLGRLRGGGFKVKGLEFCRRDAPPIVRKAAEEALRKLEPARSPSELARLAVKALRVFDSWALRLARGEVDLRDLVVERRLSKEPREYSKALPHVAAASVAGAVGVVRYIEARRPYPIDLGPGGYSLDRYLRWLDRASRPFRELIRLSRGR